MLATDQSFTDAPARRALLDVADAAGNPGQDGRFNERDLQRFLVELDGAGGVSFDFSRFDLNGDALTGGPGTEAFDLDRDGVLGSVSLATPAASRTLAENAVQDIDVLCFYAFSALFRGSAARRDQLLAGRCLPAVTAETSAVAQLDLIAFCGLPPCPPGSEERFSHATTGATSAIEPFRTVSATGGGRNAAASGQAAAGISVTTGPPVTITGTGLASAEIQVQGGGGAGGQGAPRATSSAEVVLSAPHGYVLQVTIDHTGRGGAEVHFDDQTLAASGSTSGVLQPGRLEVVAFATPFALSGEPGESASGSYTFTLTLTPQ